MTSPPVLVTGAGGFIGQALVGKLRAAGGEVATALRGAGAVVHLANIAHARVNAADLERVNVQGTREAAEHAIAAGVRRFIYMSSVKVHGDESPAGGFSAESAINPADAYGDAKARAEQALRELAQARGLQLTIVRPPLVYGPGVKANFLALMRAVARGIPLPLCSVRNRRSLVYVGNLVDLILRCLDTPAAIGRAYVVSDGAPVSTPELCRKLGAALDRPARLLAFPPALIPFVGLTTSLEVDDSAMRRELGWRPPFSLEEGLRATAHWYRSR